MPNDARINLVGNVISEPKTNQFNNSTVLSFPVSVRTTKKQENSQYYETDVYNVSVWGKQGENLLNTITKGCMVWVEGDIQMRSFKNRNNETITSPAVTASMVKMLSRGKQGAAKPAPVQNNEDTDEEEPF